MTNKDLDNPNINGRSGPPDKRTASSLDKRGVDWTLSPQVTKEIIPMTVNEIYTIESTPEFELEMARHNLEQAQRAYNIALQRVAQADVDTKMTALYAQREQARTTGAFSFLR